VLLDLHAAPCSQNGNDNSAPTAQGVVGWDADPTCAVRATAFLTALAARYAAAPALLGFGLLNEPAVSVAVRYRFGSKKPKDARMSGALINTPAIVLPHTSREHESCDGRLP